MSFAGTEFATTGLLAGDSVASVTLTSMGAAATATAASSPYAIVASDAVGVGLGNYVIGYVSGELVVLPAPQVAQPPEPMPLTLVGPGIFIAASNVMMDVGQCSGSAVWQAMQSGGTSSLFGGAAQTVCGGN